MTATVDAEAFAKDWQDWHTQHEAIIGAPHGFLAVTSINWLSDEPQTFPDAPGSWWTDESGVHVDLGEDTVVREGVALTGWVDLGVLAERRGLDLTWNDAVIEVAKRGGYDIVRPRHPSAPLVTAYHGTPAYDPDPKWAVPARFVPFEAARPTTVEAAVDRIEHVYDAVGRLEFDLDGQALALTAFAADQPGRLLVLFADATSGVTTWAANRSLPVPPPDADGDTVLDFNRATNLPCAYTDLATCPLPPAENRLTVAIEAGEKIPYERG